MRTIAALLIGVVVGFTLSHIVDTFSAQPLTSNAAVLNSFSYNCDGSKAYASALLTEIAKFCPAGVQP